MLIVLLQTRQCAISLTASRRHCSYHQTPLYILQLCVSVHHPNPRYGTILHYAGPGRDILTSGFDALRRGRPDMNSLVGLGATASFGVSCVAAALPGLGWRTFFEEPAMLLGTTHNLYLCVELSCMHGVGLSCICVSCLDDLCCIELCCVELGCVKVAQQICSTFCSHPHDNRSTRDFTEHASRT